MVTMRDSVRLATYIFPARKLPAPAILIRTPNRKSELSREIIYFVNKNYNVVVQYTRGRLGSEGVDSTFFHDGWGSRRDGYDTVQWLAAQEWCSGEIGTFGRGASAFPLVLLAGAAPPALVTQFIIATPNNFYDHVVYPGGAFRQSLVENWIEQTDSSKFLNAYIEHPSYGDFWRPLNSVIQARQHNVPTTFVTGWYEAFLNGTIQAFQIAQKYGNASNNLRLIIGPWTDNQNGMGESKQGEIEYPENARMDILQDAGRWFDHWLKHEIPEVLIEPIVKYYMMGAVGDNYAFGNRWLSADNWPVESEKRRYYLKKNGELSGGEPDEIDAAEGFVYDPENPVPTFGGANMYLEAGPRDQRKLESRRDVVVYTSPILDIPLAVAGRLRVKLYAASTAFDTDFTAKLTDVYPDGRSMLVCDGIIRARYRDSRKSPKLLKPGKVTVFDIDLGSMALIFNPGHRLRLTISSSNSPRFEPNANSPRPFRKHFVRKKATNTIYYGGKRASYIELPVVPLPPEL